PELDQYLALPAIRLGAEHFGHEPERTARIARQQHREGVFRAGELGGRGRQHYAPSSRSRATRPRSRTTSSEPIGFFARPSLCRKSTSSSDSAPPWRTQSCSASDWVSPLNCS